jgi:[protein-PII] uridylyltransferase
MATTSRMRPAVEAAREKLARGREKLREQHRAGSPGLQVCAGLSDLLDAVILDLFQEALAAVDDETGRSVALIAHGGLGRRDVAPYSDADLMLLHSAGDPQRLAPLARRFTQNLYDAGLQLGFSLRTPRQANQMAAKDATVFTSLAESRLMAGNDRLSSRFLETFRRSASRRTRALLAAIDSARRAERAQYGETVYLLCPNVKRSRGGLRDIQLIRWAGFAAYGESDLQNLERRGVLLPGERRRLWNAYEFLLRLRNELHFQAGKSQDVLDRTEQLRLAELFGFDGDAALLPVEQFMRLYFEHTGEVRYASSNFVAGARSRSGVAVFFGHLFSRSVDGDYWIGPVHIGATRRGLKKLRGDLTEVLRLMDLANLCNKRIDHPTWQAIRQEMANCESIELAPETVQRFLSLLAQPPRLGDLLRRLHQLRVLEKLVPPLCHARSLLQFNEYHKYTVDEHCIRAVERATDFQSDAGPVGEAYRQIREKRTLHLALLLHDLGKGFPDDHSDVGARLALETARHLAIPPREGELISLLVQKHLRMAHVAFRHDLNNEAVIVAFAAEVGSVEVLRLLFVLTCADVAAVGPGVLNHWKLDLLYELYDRTRQHLSSDYQGPSAKQRLLKLREKLIADIGDQPHGEFLKKQIQNLPAGYLQTAAVPQMLQELRRLADLPADEAIAWGRYIPERRAVEYTVGTHEAIVPGIFHRLTGVLSSTGHSILSAEIHTLADELVLDRFYVQDMDYSGPPPEDRIQNVSAQLVKALCHPSNERPTFRRLWKTDQLTPSGTPLRPLPERVSFDNTTSDQHTIVTVFAYDRVGLLYAITRTLFELGLSVHVAKIATHLDQVVDVFYVRDALGRKIVHEGRLDEIRGRLLEALAHG